MLEARLESELKLIADAGLTRKIMDLDFITPVKAIDETGKAFQVFSSNNYLGLSHAPEIIIAAQQAAAKSGTTSTGSRLTTGGTFSGSRLEKALAKFKHTESALVFNTGYMTNLAILYTFLQKEDAIFSDELNHASIIDGCRISKAKTIIYKHNDMQDLLKKLETTDVGGQRFIITDGVFSTDGVIANLPEIIKLKEKFNACLIVDDAHAVGVLGKDGSGTAAHFNLSDKVELQVGTLSKALAAEGGYVAGKKIFIDYLINKARPFIFSTALSPLTLASAEAALNLLTKNAEYYLGRIRDNTNLMRDLLTAEGLRLIDGDTPIIAVLIGDAQLTMEIANKLKKEGILVSGIRPPTVAIGQSRLRITVTAVHEKAEIISAAKLIGEVCRYCAKKG